MSGLERVFLALNNEEGDDSTPVIISRGIEQDALDLLYDSAQPLLEKASKSRSAISEQDVGEVPDGGIPALHQRSVLVVPLVSQGRVHGLLYGDMRHIFGRFDQSDLDSLSMLANLAAGRPGERELVPYLGEKGRAAHGRVAALPITPWNNVMPSWR